MIKLSIDVSHKVILCFILFILNSTNGFAVDPSYEVVKNRVLGLNTCIDNKYTPEVQKRINQFTGSAKDVTAVLLGRVSIYFPIFENVLREKGLPDDLKYLAVLESGLSPHATSKAGAAGLWQFMKPTGRMQGLKINSVLDERRNIVKSTYAAADYLKYLHNKFGDWTLALAAYNSGPGNVRKAIKRAGGKTNYWDIHKFLPRETRKYVPKYLAYMYVMNYYHEYGILPEMPNDQLIYTASAKINESTNLKKISLDLGLNYKTVKTLNAQFIKGYIPRNDGKYILTLPEQHMYAYANKKNLNLYNYPFATFKKIESKTIIKKTQKKAIRKKEKVSVAKLGQQKSQSEKRKNKILEFFSCEHDCKLRPFKYYSIKRKESLVDIARREDMDLSELIELNNITYDNPPKMGDIIRIYLPE